MDTEAYSLLLEGKDLNSLVSKKGQSLATDRGACFDNNCDLRTYRANLGHFFYYLAAVSHDDSTFSIHDQGNSCGIKLLKLHASIEAKLLGVEFHTQGSIVHFMGYHASDTASRIGGIPIAPGNQMNMAMEDGLAR